MATRLGKRKIDSNAGYLTCSGEIMFCSMQRKGGLSHLSRGGGSVKRIGYNTICADTMNPVTKTSIIACKAKHTTSQS